MFLTSTKPHGEFKVFKVGCLLPQGLLVSQEYMIYDNESSAGAAAGREPLSQLDCLVFLHHRVSPLLSDKHARSESLEVSHFTGRLRRHFSSPCCAARTMTVKVS